MRVAENGGFSAAARSLDVSVQALESALGVRLLKHTTRHVSLTEIGREYYDRCTQILHELEEAEQAASPLQQTPRGQLRVYQGLAPPSVQSSPAFWPGTRRRQSICAPAT